MGSWFLSARLTSRFPPNNELVASGIAQLSNELLNPSAGIQIILVRGVVDAVLRCGALWVIVAMSGPYPEMTPCSRVAVDCKREWEALPNLSNHLAWFE